MTQESKLSQFIGLGLLTLIAAFPALATTSGGEVAADAFNAFADTVITWLKGGLGIGIAIAALIVGGGTAAATGKPLVMVGAIVVAMMFAFGPGILEDLVSEGQAVVSMIPGLTM